MHSERYLRLRVLPKLLDDSCPMFRYYSCKFKLDPSKSKTARVVLFKEFNIANCYTLEASMHGYYDQEKKVTEDHTTERMREVGVHMGEGIHEMIRLVDEDILLQ